MLDMAVDSWILRFEKSCLGHVCCMDIIALSPLTIT